jgi:hypothetical protein
MLSEIASPDGQRKLEELIQALVEFHSSKMSHMKDEEALTLHQLSSPVDIGKQCNQPLKKGKVLDFYTMMMFICLRFAIHRSATCQQHSKYIYSILYSWKPHKLEELAQKIGDSNRSLRFWKVKATRICYLAGSGSSKISFYTTICNRLTSNLEPSIFFLLLLLWASKVL